MTQKFNYWMYTGENKNTNSKDICRDFPGGPVAGLCAPGIGVGVGHGFAPRELDPTCCNWSIHMPKDSEFSQINE